MPRMVSTLPMPRAIARIACLGALWLQVSACGALGPSGEGGEGGGRSKNLPMADPGFPAGYRRWPTVDPVADENTGTVHHLYRAPDQPPDRKGRFSVGAVLVKEHVVPGEDDLIVRIDVRRRLAAGTYGGWEYESFDPATRKRLDVDPEACDLCHQTAPADATFARFPAR